LHENVKREAFHQKQNKSMLRRAMSPWGGKLPVHPEVTLLKIQKTDTESVVCDHYKYL